MDDRLRPHLDALLAEAGAAAAVGSWTSARSLAQAALALDPTHEGARRTLDLAEAALGAGERRQLTVMFCDVVGSTGLSQANDPEILREVLRSYRNVLDTVVARAEGQIALWIGDGALVYFGHPTPHEDDAWRAVHTGLSLLADLDPVIRGAWADHRLDLSVRVAVHTGLVVRAEMGTNSAPDRDAIVGATPNLAARLQDKARPGTMLISEATHELVRGRFAVVPVGPFRLRGFDDPISAFAVEFEVAMSSAVDLVSQRGSFVGRTAELASLRDRWTEVRAGGSAAVLVTGEPGIGKTRLVAELRRFVLEDEGRVLEASCSSFHSATPLHPVRRLVEVAAGIDARRPAERLGRLEAVLTASGFGHAAAALATQLGFDDAPPASATITPELPKERELALGALVGWITAEAARRPLLLALDDLQWIDPTSLEILSAVMARRPRGLLVVLTARTDFRSIWSESSVANLPLAPLPAREASALANDVAAGTLSPAVISNLVERCDGVPLFVEELVRAALVDDDALVSIDHIVPASLRDPLLARLAAAGGDFALPQLVATIGDGAPIDLLRAVGGWSETELEARLATSTAAGVLVQSRDGHVRFRHHLLAELAYDTQLHRVRKDRHAATAMVLAAEPSRTDAATLAHHLEHAGQTASAIESLLRAARATQRKGAHTEAMAQLDHALTLLEVVAEEGTRLHLELLIREARHFSWAAMLSSGSPAAVADFARCLQLLQELPPRADHDPIYVSVFGHLLMTGRINEADRLNRSGRHRFSEHRVDEIAMPVDAGACLTSFFGGDITGSLESGRRFLDSPAGRLDAPVPEGYPLPNELVATIGSTVAASLVLAGEVEAARTLFTALDARTASLPFPHGPYTAGWIKSLEAFAWFNLHDEPAFRATSEELRALTLEHGMDSYSLISNLHDAMADVRFGVAASAGHMITMLSVWRFTGADSWLPCFSEVAAEAHRKTGDDAAALALIDESIELGRRTGVRFWEAQLTRLRGIIRLDAGEDAGLDDLVRAAALANEQGAKLFELTARADLVRNQPDAPAVKELSDVVRAFSERLHFATLDDARQLVERHGRS